MRRCATLLAVTACWSEGPKPATPPPPKEPLGCVPESSVCAAVERRPRWRPGSPGVQKAPQEKRPPDQIARELASTLRASGSQVMTTYVAGPMVVLDLDAGTLTTECDSAATTAALSYGVLFEDPTRPTPHCRATDKFTCSQFASQQTLIVEFADPDSWRIVSVIVGNFRTGRTTMSQKMGLMRQQIATAACP